MDQAQIIALLSIYTTVALLLYGFLTMKWEKRYRDDWDWLFTLPLAILWPVTSILWLGREIAK